MSLYHRININKKILLFTDLPLIIFLLILNIAMIYNERTSLRDTINEYQRDMARNVAHLVSGPLHRSHYHSIDDIVVSSQEYSEILYTEVYSSLGRVSNAPKSNEGLRNYTTQDADVYYQGKRIGRVVICFDNTPLDKKVLNYTIKLAIWTLFFIIVIQSVLFFSIRTIVIKPLDKMLNTVTGISKGDLSLSVPVLSQDEIGVLGTNFNYMVKKLRESNALTQAILESMPSTLIAIDDNYRIINCNSQIMKFKNLFETDLNKVESDQKNETNDLTRQQVCNHEQSIWEAIPYLKKHKRVAEYVLKTKKPLKLHRESITKEGFYQIFIFPLENSDINGLVFRIDDVTADELKDAQLREALKLDTLGALASGLAHDFNNVLCGIVSTVSILKFRLQNKASLSFEKIESLTNVIDESAVRAEEMVKQFLGLSRKQEMNFTQSDLNASITHIAKIGKNTFDKSVKLEVILFPEKALAIIDRTQIEQVFLNLAVNGSHAMTLMKKDNWGGTLTIKIEEAQLNESQKSIHPAETADSFWKISFTDEGVGMTEEIKKKIFEPFFTTKEVGKGTGLGLSMVFSIVSAHNGFVDLESEYGAGSSFQVFLPKLVIEDTGEENANTEIIVQKGNQETILVVDDEHVVRQTITNILDEANYKTLLAESGTEAIKIYKKNHENIDIVLIDYKMPDINGLDTFAQLKEINPKIKAILSSGLKEEVVLEGVKIKSIDEKNVQSIGFKQFLQKPYTIEKLSKILDKVIQEKDQ